MRKNLVEQTHPVSSLSKSGYKYCLIPKEDLEDRPSGDDFHAVAICTEQSGHKSWSQTALHYVSEFEIQQSICCVESEEPVALLPHIWKVPSWNTDMSEVLLSWSLSRQIPIFFFMALQPVAGLGHLYEIPWSHPDTPLSVRFFWTCVRHVSETATYTTRNTHKWQTSCLRRDSNPKFQQASGRKPFP